MKIIILAAGQGSRLRMGLPKALIPLANGKSILDCQLDAIKGLVPEDAIRIVVGYKHELIRHRYQRFDYVINDFYATTNTGKSLLKGIADIDDDVLWLNGDVFLEKDVLRKLLYSRYSGVLVDGKKCGDEEVKYRTNSKGYICEISKTVVEAEGEALGVNVVLKRDLPLFREHLRQIGDKDYFEKAIENMIIRSGIRVTPIDVGDLFCSEIDFFEDLVRVNDHLSKDLDESAISQTGVT